MSSIVVSGGQIKPTYHGSETTLKMRIYCRRSFTASSLEAVQAGAVDSDLFYTQVNCTVAGGIISYAGFTIDSTEDGNPSNSYYTFVLYTDAGDKIAVIYKKIIVPITPTPTTLGALAVYTTTL